MSNHPHYDQCLAIAERDPNAGSTQPTAADHTRHQQWALDTFGADVWTTYTTVSWGTWGTDPV